jgi:hypothetical protein
MLSVDTEFPESADEAFYTMFQGLFDALKERFDDLGWLGLGEDVLPEESLHDVGLGIVGLEAPSVRYLSKLAVYPMAQHQLRTPSIVELKSTIGDDNLFRR